MRFISSRTHGIIDYGTGLLLLVAPYLLGFANGGAAQYAPMAIGAAIIDMSLFTDYELSLSRVIPLPAHLIADVGSGLLLAASPWLFGFSNRVFWPHLIVGLFEVAAGLMTRTTPDSSSAAR
jgi:hypothetical protein